MRGKIGNKISINIIILLILAINILSPHIYGKTESTGNLHDLNELQYIKSIVNESLLDLEYIHNITENLSYIIFTAYAEEYGEIAQGRAFGTKGEHMAADILYENMTKLGLYTKKEELNNTVVTLADVPKIASKIETLKRGLAVYDIKNHSKTAITDYYIGAVRNFTDFGGYTSSILRKLKNGNVLK